jgi:hypothetical protein
MTAIDVTINEPLLSPQPPGLPIFLWSHPAGWAAWLVCSLFPLDTGEFLVATQNKIDRVQFSDIRSGSIKILRVWSFRLDTHRPVQQAEL